MNSHPRPSLTLTPPESEELWLEVLREQLRTMRFGVIQLTVHEGRVMHIERTERIRLDASPGVVRQDLQRR